MSVTHCALSGEPLIEPVVSTKTGHVFEKKLICKHIAETGQCPITGLDLEKGDLCEIQVSKIAKPRQITSSGIPGMLNILQSEWESLMLSTFTLKKHMQTLREELSHSLYQYDAACRVIARVIKERDTALEELAKIQHIVQEGSGNNIENIGVEDNRGIYDELLTKITLLFESLTKHRKHLKRNSNLCPVGVIREFKETKSLPIHSPSAPGIMSMDIDIPNSLILTGGKDHKGVVLDLGQGKIINSLQNTPGGMEVHKKRINCGRFAVGNVVLGSADGSGSVWRLGEDGGYIYSARVEGFGKGVTGVSVHPLGNYALFTSKDATWTFTNLDTAVHLLRVGGKGNGSGSILCGEFHPDGLLMATGGVDQNLRIWDIRTQNNQITIPAHNSALNCVCFSNKGYYMATSGIKDSVVNIWDLRKLAATQKPCANIDTQLNAVKSIKFDYSGQYLGIAGEELKLYYVKNWEYFAQFSHGEGVVNDFVFTQNSQSIVTAGNATDVRIFN